MKVKFTSLKFLVIALVFAQAVAAQSVGDYQTTGANTLWNNTATWARWDGVSWVTPATPPTSADGVITILNSHTVQVNAAVIADQLVVAAGGTLNNDVGGINLSLADGAGTDLQVNGTYLLRGNNTLGISSGTPQVGISGVMNWYSGVLSVNTTVAVGGSLNVDQFDFIKRLSATLVNNGTFTWVATTAAIEFFNGVLTNNGTFTITSTSGNLVFSNLGGTNSITNTGIFNKTSVHSFANNAIPVTNSGGMYGLGTYNFTGTITNTGIIAPGNPNSIATLGVTAATITGQSPTLAIHILSGAGPGTGHDQINITGAVDISTSSLQVTENTSAPIQTYTIITAPGGITGTFASTNIPQGYTLQVNATDVTVTKTVVTLPVLWGTFNAQAKGNQVQLIWSTLQEFNTSHFVVEYSKDGNNFTPIATVPAAGNSSTKKDYSFVHSSPVLTKNNFYRIQQVDIDARSTNSAIRTVRFSNGNVVAVLATPNPVHDKLQLTVQADGISVRLLDLSGRSVRTMNVQAGVQQLNVADLPNGIYQLVIYQDNKQIGVQRLVKQ